MLDIKLIRSQPDTVRAALATLGGDAFSYVDEVLAIDENRRAIRQCMEGMQGELNAVSKEIGRRRRLKEDTADAEEKARALREDIRTQETALAPLEAKIQDILVRIPNLPHPRVPVGKDDTENIVAREEGEKRGFDFEPRPHWEIGEALGIIDFERGVKISGTRFYILKGDGARLQRALITWMIDLHVRKHGYTEIYPPYMVLPQCVLGTGQLPKFADTMYRDAEDGFYFIPTAEVPVTNMYREEILAADSLPVKHVAFTACFRREAMSAGRDVRGIKRGHQFDKVEMVKFVRPETSDDELMSLLNDAEDVARELQLSHRVIEMCTGDLSFTAARKFDVEIWAPGCQEWLEVSSCSSFGDFQARRANIRFRDAGGKPEFLHTLNGSGLALPRTMIGIIESGQTAEGTIVIPEVLRPYMGGQDVIGKQG
ncbi:MAG TPA: serine--tRNA ligase [Armatimonadota bacterium]|jgi:seryl-tRNA synthetase